MRAIFISFVFFTSLLVTIYKNKLINNTLYHTFLYLIIISSTTYIFAKKELSDFPDRLIYKLQFEQNQGLNLIESFSAIPFDKGFVALQWLISQITHDYNVYFGIIYFIFFITISICFRLVFKSDFLIPLSLFVLAPLFPILSGNIIRTGLSFSLFLLGTILYQKGIKIKWIIPMILSISMHLSIAPLVVLFVILRKKMHDFSKSIIFGLAVSSLIFISNTQLTIFPFLNSFDKISIYNSVDLFDRYSTNLLRFDFFFFNILLLVILFVLSKSSNQQSNEKHNFYLNITVLCVIYFNIFGFIAFSDRIAIYTWLFTIFTATLIIFDWKKYNIILVPIVYLIVVFTFAVYTSNLFF